MWGGVTTKAVARSPMGPPARAPRGNASNRPWPHWSVRSPWAHWPVLPQATGPFAHRTTGRPVPIGPPARSPVGAGPTGQLASLRIGKGPASRFSCAPPGTSWLQDSSMKIPCGAPTSRDFSGAINCGRGHRNAPGPRVGSGQFAHGPTGTPGPRQLLAQSPVAPTGAAVRNGPAGPSAHRQLARSPTPLAPSAAAPPPAQLVRPFPSAHRPVRPVAVGPPTCSRTGQEPSGRSALWELSFALWERAHWPVRPWPHRSARSPMRPLTRPVRPLAAGPLACGSTGPPVRHGPISPFAHLLPSRGPFARGPTGRPARHVPGGPFPHWQRARLPMTRSPRAGWSGGKALAGPLSHQQCAQHPVLPLEMSPPAHGLLATNGACAHWQRARVPTGTGPVLALETGLPARSLICNGPFGLFSQWQQPRRPVRLLEMGPPPARSPIDRRPTGPWGPPALWPFVNGPTRPLPLPSHRSLRATRWQGTNWRTRTWPHGPLGHWPVNPLAPTPAFP